MEIAAVFKLIIALITGKAGVATIAAVVGMAIGLAGKKLPKLLGSLLTKEIAKGFDKIGQIKDPVLKQLVDNWFLDTVKIAEHMLPDAGQGRARFELVASWAVKAFPMLAGNEKALADLIENAVSKMDEALKIKVVK